MGIPFTEVELVDALSDPASFFGADVNSNHSRIVLSPGATHAAHLGTSYVCPAVCICVYEYTACKGVVSEI